MEKKEKIVFRQCCITKKIFPRTELSRLVRLPNGQVFMEKKEKLVGRGIHFHKNSEIAEKFWDERKRKMVAHFLRAEISVSLWASLRDEFFNSVFFEK